MGNSLQQFRMIAGFVATLFAFAAWSQSVPPRSAADVLAILDDYKADPAKVAQLRAEVAKPVPQTTDPVDLLRFYSARADAAAELGLVNQQLADLRKAIELAPPGNPERWSLFIQIAAAEQQAGNYATAVKMFDSAPEAATLGGQKLSAYAAAAGQRAFIGDLARAREALATAQSLLTQLNGSRQWGLFADNWRAQAERARGQVLRAEGKHAEAEVAFRQTLVFLNRVIANHAFITARSRSPFPPLNVFVRNAVRWEAGLLAPTLLDQGKFAEAELAARNALKRSLGTFGKYSPESGSALAQLARTVFEQGRFSESAALFGAVVGIYETIGAAPHASTLVNALRGLGATLVEDGNYAEADRTFTRMRAGLQTAPDSARYIGTSSPQWVYALVKLGRPAEAVTQAASIYGRHKRIYGEAFYGTLEARAFHALALAADGRTQEALREFRACVPSLLAAAGERSSEEGIGLGRAQQLKRILDAYIALLGRHAGEGVGPDGFDPVAEAFLVADAARGSSVQRALTAATARSSISEPELAKLAREEQDAAQRVGSLSGILVDLLSRAADKQLPVVIGTIHEDIDALRKQRARLRQEIERRFPEYANLTNPKPIPLEVAREALKPGESLLVLYGVEDRTLVWAVPQEGAVRFQAAALGRRDIDAAVAALRSSLDVGDVPLDRFPRFDVAAAFRLFDALLAPVEPAWNAAKSLLIVPHGALAQLPFSLLVTDNKGVGAESLRFDGYKSVSWLVRRAAVTQLPSVNTLASLRSVKRSRAPSKTFIGFGDPVFGPLQLAQGAAPVATRSMRLRNLALSASDQKAPSITMVQLAPLPDTAEELEGFAGALGADPQQDLFLRLKASEQAVKTADLSDRRVIAFATHGLVAGEIDGLTQPALALSNPEMTGDKDSDGLLAMDEILALKLNADWVVLSACNTASAGGAGEEAVSGLGRAFFYAGARALLVSNWPIETVSAKLLTTDLFRRQAADPKLARAEALRQAMLQLIDRGVANIAGKPFYSYAHPMFWAPFSLVGDGN